MYNWRGVPRGDTQACANPPLIRERAVSALLPLTTIVRADVLMLNPRRDFLRPSPLKRTRGGGWDRRRKRRVTGVCPRACEHNFNTHYLATRCACTCSHTRHRPDAHGQSCNVGDTRPMSTKSSTNTPQNLSNTIYAAPRWPVCDSGHANGYTLATSTRNSHASSLRTEESSVAPFALRGASAIQRKLPRTIHEHLEL